MLRPYNIVRILRRHHATLPPPGRAPFIQDHIDGEPMQPGAEGALTPKRPQLVPQSHEDILRALLGVPGIAGETKTQRVDPPAELAIYLPEGRLVAGLGAGDEIVRHDVKTPSCAAAFGAR